MGRPFHVVPNEGGWATKREGNKRLATEHRKKSAAKKVAKRLAREKGVGVTIHRRDGTVMSGIPADMC